MQSDTIQIRVSPELKSKAKKTFSNMGLDISSAINLFLRQTTIRQELPFKVLTENGFTKEYEKEILVALKNNSKGKKIYSSAKDMHKDILGKDYKKYV